MHYRRLGRSGLKVSELSLGAWITFGNQLGDQLVSDLLHTAFDQGINFFDNADIYANGQAESMMGNAIQDIPREALVLSSKVFWPTMPGPNGRGLSRKHIMESLHASLKRMNVEYFDLYFCHRYDPDTPLDEICQTMDLLVRQGKILYWGTSMWEASQVAMAIGTAKQYNLIGPVVEQPQYNMVHRNRVEIELDPLVKEYGLGLTTWSPLYFGLLSGKYNEGIPLGSRATLEDVAWINDDLTQERINTIRKLTSLAQELEMTTAQLAIAWILRRKEISSVITGATRLEQLDENLMAAEMVGKLTDEILEQIETIIEEFKKPAD
jgi:voltage-dependent potassium channel beta subunit